MREERGERREERGERRGERGERREERGGERERRNREEEAQLNLLLYSPGGEQFEMTSDGPHYKVGDVVTVEYESHARREVPVGPRIVRIRTDVSWEDVLRDHASDLTNYKTGHCLLSSCPLLFLILYLNMIANIYVDQNKPRDQWNWRDRKDTRKFFEEFASSLNMEPLNPETWYSITRQFLEEKVYTISDYLSPLPLSLFPMINKYLGCKRVTVSEGWLPKCPHVSLPRNRP